MSKNGQAQRFRIAAKKRLVERNLSITALASRLGYARNTVSMAINHRRFPGVLSAIRTELDLAE